jgi:2-phosphosulfolactate phosphatase
MSADRRVVIDFLPEAARPYGDDWAVVAVDILRSTTTAVTIAWSGRRCLPVSSLEAARELATRLDRPLLVGEVGGELPEGFDFQNSPAALARYDHHRRPAVLLSTSGTRIFGEATRAGAIYAACLRNVTAQVAHLTAHHPKVAVIGAGTKGEFRREDQLGCARVAAGLLAAGYRACDEATEAVVERWRDAPVEACAGGRSAAYLERTGQLDDLDFILSHVNDVDAVFAFADGELRPALA